MQQMADVMQGAVTLLARLMIAAVFASAVANKVLQFSSTAAYMASEGVPVPKFALFGATFYFHDFWRFVDPGQRQLQTIQFMKNLAIGGGLLTLAAYGGGPWSVDGWIALKQEEAESTPKQRTAAKT